ncbi:AMP deaminase [Entamoeba marina]
MDHNEIYSQDEDFVRFSIQRSLASVRDEDYKAASALDEALKLREKYLLTTTNPVYPDHHKTEFVETSDDNVEFRLSSGCTTVYYDNKPQFTPITYEMYLKDYQRLLDICDNGPVKSFSTQRLQELDSQYTLHCLLNSKKAKNSDASLEDIHTIQKVDTHIHAAACMTEKQLLEFLKLKNATAKDEFVGYYTTDSGEKELETLGRMCKRLNIQLENLTLNQLGVRAGIEFFQRFDVFNASYKIGGLDLLRTVFLKSENAMQGKYFAELIHGVFKSMDNTPTHTELRLSIYGRSKTEWSKLAQWIDKWDLQHKQNRWMIQFPRIYHVCASGKDNFSFSNYIDNLFQPLFENTAHPQKDMALSKFLSSVSGFDSVDDESAFEQTMGTLPTADQWKHNNPPYFYYMYYLYANFATLNYYRKSRGMNTFDFRPHCGESGDTCHLASAFLTSKAINHGIRLNASSPLQYLYYLKQIGLAISPLSNHNLFLSYENNPFGEFFKRGLNVSLSSDDPLQFHRTQQPLLEEYAIAQQTFNYVTGDLAEIAYNSVIQSGFTVEEKEEMVGKEYWNYSKENAERTRHTRIRMSFRKEMLNSEHEYLKALITNDKEYQSKIFTSIPYSNIQVTYPRIGIPEEVDVIKNLEYWLDVRQKYLTFCTQNRNDVIRNSFHPNSAPIEIATFDKGVMNIYANDVCCERDGYHLAVLYCQDCKLRLCKKCFKETHKHTYHSLTEIHSEPMYNIIPPEQYFEDYISLCNFCRSGPARSFCFKQLHARTELFRLYRLLNSNIEGSLLKTQQTDFDQIVKVDTHVHANRSFHPTDLLNIITTKLKNEPERVVAKQVTVDDVTYNDVKLAELFDILGVKKFDLNTLGVRSDPSLIQRYDLWLNKYYPFNKHELKELFISTNNYIHGEYLCELLKTTVFDRLASSTNIKTEYRFNVSGAFLNELDGLAEELVNSGLIYPDVNSYVIAVPRIYARFKAENKINTFSEFLRNIFQPCINATLFPSRHPALSAFLSNVGAFDSASEEFVHEPPINPKSFPNPDDWDFSYNPPYEYYMYYFYANIKILNAVRSSRGLNTFDFRPHCGEAGNPMHSTSAFLTADSIQHGVTLDKQNTLQYLYCLAQIGISASPSVQTALYDRKLDPFYKMFERGMRICLSTDNPLHIHTTKEPLIEEYASAAKNFRMSAVDLAETARNSVLISSFPDDLKKLWIGEKFQLMGGDGNVPDKTNIPNMRLAFRFALFQNEVNTFEKWLRNAD